MLGQNSEQNKIKKKTKIIGKNIGPGEDVND